MQSIQQIEEDVNQEYILYLVINLIKTTQLDTLKQLIQDSAHNCECESEYFTHETEGINNTITKNNLIYVVTFTTIQNLESYIEFIKSFHDVEIESIFHNNTIIHGSKNYIKSLNRESIDPHQIKNQLSKNHNNPFYKKIFTLLSK